MKRRKIALIILGLFLVGQSLFISASAERAYNPESSYVADAEMLEMLYQKHLELRDEKAEISEYQKDYLMALGIDKKAFDTITYGEIADLLKSGGDIINPQYLSKYIDEDQLISEAHEAKRVIAQKLFYMGLTQEEVEEFFVKGLNISEYGENDADRIRDDLKKQVSYHPKSASCHIFRGTQVVSLLNEDNAHFHSDAYPLYTVWNDLYLTLPKNPDPGTTAYEAKLSILSSNLTDTSNYVKKLYGVSSTSGIAYNYFLYGEESPGFHEGIDSQRYSGATLKSVCNGTVVKKTVGSSSSLSTLHVYHPSLDVTVIYMHLEISSSVTVNSTISTGDTIGVEASRGASSAHTHIQIQSGQVTGSAASGQDSTLTSLKPYAYLSLFI